jgi:hypothetical protein
MYKSKFAKLHEMVLSTYDNEKILLVKAKELHAQLTVERAKLEEKSNQSTSNNNMIQQMRSDLDREAIEVNLRDPCGLPFFSSSCIERGERG